MLDKASRQADGPPTQDPGDTATGRGTRALRRRWNRAVHPLSAAVRRGTRPDTADETAAPPEPADQELTTRSGRRPAARQDSERQFRAQHSDKGHTGSETVGPGREDAPETPDPGPRGTPETAGLGDSPPETPGHDFGDAALGTAGETADVTEGRSVSLDRAAATGGGLVIAPGWRERAAAQVRTPGSRVAATRWLRRSAAALWYRRPTRADLADLVARRPSAEEIAAVARRHRVLIGVLLLALLMAAGDGSTGIAVTDRSPVPGIAYRVALAHPLQLSTPVPSVRRYLDAIDNGERLREQAVVAAAARATLERAKAEAAAAVAGREQPWINTAPAPGALEGGVIPPGAV
ncbi:hypothetical protein ABZV91_31110, partial [Nocardia sp. NPDC004568]